MKSNRCFVFYVLTNLKLVHFDARASKQVNEHAREDEVFVGEFKACHVVIDMAEHD